MADLVATETSAMELVVDEKMNRKGKGKGSTDKK
jgi:hypothetical protein